MRINRFSDLALRLLMYLGSRPEPMQATVTVRAAAGMFNVPYAHLVKVAHQLGQQGFLITSKGAGGGLRLARSAESISVGEILRVVEPGDSVIDCYSQLCPLAGACLLKGALDSAYAAFLDKLDEYSLAEVARTPRLQKLVYLKPEAVNPLPRTPRTGRRAADSPTSKSRTRARRSI
ncbi:MAG TPA: Rrf2 family transcriptional regulator [Edaphobacter sp.]|uniref:RrF2 family transcriptional regulator n=1 Tax=Edaphobacter sp. TaxID=1934404 RepID=UPI002B662CFD|nr:Rrf2 family transcriptional regulator [Edaphobacter sp.]HUZ93410.1 Rrf2 family transcriptional regulator [Edaphobacter sp.]